MTSKEKNIWSTEWVEGSSTFDVSGRSITIKTLFNETSSNEDMHTIYVCNTSEEADIIAKLYINDKSVIGLDVEMDSTSGLDKPCLISMSNGRQHLIYNAYRDLGSEFNSTATGETPDWLHTITNIPRRIWNTPDWFRTIMNNDKVVKVVCSEFDRESIESKFSTQKGTGLERKRLVCRRFWDLQTHVMLFKKDLPLKLSSLFSIYYGQQIPEEEATSRWDVLSHTKSQLSYAASGAYCALACYHAFAVTTTYGSTHIIHNNVPRSSTFTISRKRKLYESISEFDITEEIINKVYSENPIMPTKRREFLNIFLNQVGIIKKSIQPQQQKERIIINALQENGRPVPEH